jgi:hypothetical protein
MVQKRNNIAIENGWNIIRITVNDKEIIQPDFLDEYILLNKI